MILQALKSNIKDDSKPSQVGDESSFAIMEVWNEGNNNASRIARANHLLAWRAGAVQGGCLWA